MLPGITPALMGGPAVSQGNDSFTKLLLHFDTMGVPSTIVDSSPSQHGYATVQGGMTLPSGTGYFGPSSMYNPNNSYIYWTTGVTDFDFGAGDFTIDWREYRPDASDSRPIIVRNVDGTTYQPYLIWSSGGICQFYASGDNASWNVCSALSLGSIVANQWCHRAIVRQGNTFYGFKDGVLQATAAAGGAMYAGVAGAGPMIGLWVPGGTTTYYYNGYLDEFRISKGIARWTANFTPRPTPYAPDPPTHHYYVSTPASAKKGTAVSITVQALNSSGFITSGYTGTVHFTSTDGTASLPANSTLTNGVGTFSVTFNTVGNFTVTATDTANGAITGASGSIPVTTGPASPQTIAIGSSGTWTVPADWTTNNSIECIGGGGGGCSTGGAGGGGGGGAYAKISNRAYTPGQVINLVVGGGGGAGGGGGYTQFGPNYCLAYGGSPGTTPDGGANGSGGAGGTVGAGDVGYSGGAGGNATGGVGAGAGGGGGAGGMHGGGGPGGSMSGSGVGGGGGGGGGGAGGVGDMGGSGAGGAGGNNYAGYGGGASGGYSANGGAGSAGGGGGGTNAFTGFAGGAGGNGIEWTSWGSGGGGGGGTGGNGGNGGYFGGGGGSGMNGSAGGAGAQGLIIIKYQ